MVTVTIISPDSASGSERKSVPNRQTPTLNGPSFPAQAAHIYESANKPFLIHKDNLCQHSPFFNSAFNGSFRETVSQSMSFSDVDPEIFGLLVNWVYTQNVVDENYNVPELCTSPFALPSNLTTSIAFKTPYFPLLEQNKD